MRAAIFGLSVLALQWGSDDVEAVGSISLSRTNHEGTRREGQAPGLGTAPTVDVVSQGKLLSDAVRLHHTYYGGTRF